MYNFSLSMSITKTPITKRPRKSPQSIKLQKASLSIYQTQEKTHAYINKRAPTSHMLQAPPTTVDGHCFISRDPTLSEPHTIRHVYLHARAFKNSIQAINIFLTHISIINVISFPVVYLYKHLCFCNFCMFIT